MTSFAIRAAQAGDLPQLTEIYNHYVRTSPVTFDLEPYAVERRREWFDHYHPTGRHRLLVAVDADTVLGYATSSAWRPKAAYATTVETSVYCAPDATGRGVGTALYTQLFAQLAGEDVHRAVAGIVVPNEASVRLHARVGFRDVGVFAEVGRKFDRYWDVLWMQRALGSAALVMREYRSEDLAAVVALVRDALTEHGLGAHADDVARSLAAWRPAERSAFLVAELDGRLAGTVAIVPHEGRTCELTRLYLRGDLRGRGLGQRLYAHAEAFARQAGYARLWLTSSRRFARAHRLYERNGMIRTERLENDWEDDVFVKAL